jgi:hypothetical protein
MNKWKNEKITESINIRINKWKKEWINERNKWINFHETGIKILRVYFSHNKDYE